MGGRKGILGLTEGNFYSHHLESPLRSKGSKVYLIMEISGLETPQKGGLHGRVHESTSDVS